MPTLRRNVVVSLAAKANQGTPTAGEAASREEVSGRLGDEITSHHSRSYRVHNQQETLNGVWDYREVSAGSYQAQ